MGIPSLNQNYTNCQKGLLNGGMFLGAVAISAIVVGILVIVKNKGTPVPVPVATAIVNWLEGTLKEQYAAYMAGSDPTLALEASE